MESHESQNSIKRLYKSRHDKIIDGVCAGVAEYFGLNVALVRILWTVSIFFGGAGIVAYITAMVLVPANPAHLSSASLTPEEHAKINTTKNFNHGLFWGSILILIGLIIFLDDIDIFEFRWFWRHFMWDWFLPGVFIIGGIILIARGTRKTSIGTETKSYTDFSNFKRSSTQKKIFGICSGLSNRLQIDVSIIRILWVIITFITPLVGVVIYLLIAFLTPDENNQNIFSSKTVKKES